MTLWRCAAAGTDVAVSASGGVALALADLNISANVDATEAARTTPRSSVATITKFLNDEPVADGGAASLAGATGTAVAAATLARSF